MKLYPILLEMTNRQGPRTGAFEFDDDEIHDIAAKILERFIDDIENNVFEDRMYVETITSPIDGKKVKIKFDVREPDVDDDVEANADVGGDHIRVFTTREFAELTKRDPNEAFKNLKSTLYHEISHIFDKKRMDKDYYQNYHNTNTETKAILQQKYIELRNSLNPQNMSDEDKKYLMWAIKNKKFDSIMIKFGSAGPEWANITDPKVKRKYYTMLWHVLNEYGFI